MNITNEPVGNETPALTPSPEQVEALKHDYRESLKTVATANETLQPKRDALNAQIAELELQFTKDNADTLSVRNAAQEAADLDESTLRVIAINHFVATGEKTFDENLGVRVNRKLEYPANRAVTWAETNAPFMIVKSVDKKAFEAVPNIEEFDFVTVEETTTAVLKGLR